MHIKSDFEICIPVSFVTSFTWMLTGSCHVRKKVGSFAYHLFALYQDRIFEFVLILNSTWLVSSVAEGFKRLAKKVIRDSRFDYISALLSAIVSRQAFECSWTYIRRRFVDNSSRCSYLQILLKNQVLLFKVRRRTVSVWIRSWEYLFCVFTPLCTRLRPWETLSFSAFAQKMDEKTPLFSLHALVFSTCTSQISPLQTSCLRSWLFLMPFTRSLTSGSWVPCCARFRVFLSSYVTPQVF